MREGILGNCLFIDAVPNYAVKSGTMLIWTKDWSIAMPLPIFCQGMAKANEVIAKWQVEQLSKEAEVVPMRGRRKH